MKLATILSVFHKQASYYPDQTFLKNMNDNITTVNLSDSNVTISKITDESIKNAHNKYYIKKAAPIPRVSSPFSKNK